MSEKPLHLVFKNIKSDVVDATRTLISSGVDGDFDDVIGAFQEWADTCTDLYHVPRVAMEYFYEDKDSMYEGDTILFINFNYVQIFHQFRHHMQQYGRSDFRHPEMDAVSWACSLFHSVSPGKFERAVRDGNVSYIRPHRMIPATRITNECKPLNDNESTLFENLAEEFMDDADDEVVQLMEQFGQD